MGNNCHGSQNAKTKKKYNNLSSNPSSPSLSHTFNFDAIQNELNKSKLNDATKINLDTILDELKKLNSCSIAVHSYALTNFNVPLGNVLCATCFR